MISVTKHICLIFIPGSWFTDLTDTTCRSGVFRCWPRLKLTCPADMNIDNISNALIKMMMTVTAIVIVIILILPLILILV